MDGQKNGFFCFKSRIAPFLICTREKQNIVFFYKLLRTREANSEQVFPGGRKIHKNMNFPQLLEQNRQKVHIRVAIRSCLRRRR
jgi:hypothetical protein